jgi:hypothetical protein
MAILNTDIHDRWELFNSLYEAFRQHDGDKLSDVMRHKNYQRDEIGPTGTYTLHNNYKDFIQVLTECMYEINQRLEAIENAK